MNRHEPDKHRHNVVRLVFGQYLEEKDLDVALALIDRHDLRNASGAIGYVSAIAQKFGFNHEMRRHLCIEFYSHLQKPAPTEPPPLPEPVRQKQPEANVFVPAAITPVAPLLQPETSSSPASPQGALPAAPQIFMLLGDAVYREVQARGGDSQADFIDALRDILREQKPWSSVLSGWPEQAMDVDELIHRTGEELAELFHLLYLALCDALGPVPADKVLQKVAAEVDRHPAAVEFSPRKLF